VYGLKQYKQYLLGRHFVVRTDHAALSWWCRTAEPMPQLACWLTFIEQFDYEILHRPGTQHGNADGLSRRPIEVSGDDHANSARVAAISCGPASQKGATFDSRKAAAFLYQRLPSMEEIGVGDAEVYCAPDDAFLYEMNPTPMSSGENVLANVGDAEVYCENAADFVHALPESSEDSASASIGDAEVYCENTPEPLNSPTVHTVKAITKEEGDTSGLAGGNLADAQMKDKEIGALVAMHLCSNTAPSSDEAQTESELTKKLLLGWNDLVVKDGIVYRRKVKFKSGDAKSRK